MDVLRGMLQEIRILLNVLIFMFKFQFRMKKVLVLETQRSKFNFHAKHWALIKQGVSLIHIKGIVMEINIMTIFKMEN